MSCIIEEEGVVVKKYIGSGEDLDINTYYQSEAGMLT
jgi:hypothetical protein